jgi:Effector Associated Constant Component 1
MQDGGSRWRLVVPTGGDTLRQERLTRDLYEALRESDRIAVGFEDTETPVEAGRKGVAADAALWATVSLPAARVLIALINAWSSKERHRSVKVTYRGRSVTITGRPDAGQERMVRDFLDGAE